MGDMQQSLTPILILMAACGALVAGLAIWLASTDQVAVNTEESEVTIDEPLAITEQTPYEPMNITRSNPVAVITTNRGVIELELFDDAMPVTAGNFMKLANEGFYDGTKFHRVIDGFMIQGGDPNSKTENALTYGTGGPGYTIPDEHIAGERLTNVRGTIAMANSGPESGGSQFFINLVDNVNLDFDKPPATSKHPVFGQVINGFDVVEAIGKTEVAPPANIPVEPVIVESVVIQD